MNNLEKRIEKLERSRQVSEGEVVQVRAFIYTSTEEPRPTDEEIEAAEKKFLEEHPGHQGIIVLNFLHPHGGSDEQPDYDKYPPRPFREVTK